MHQTSRVVLQSLQCSSSTNAYLLAWLLRGSRMWDCPRSRRIFRLHLRLSSLERPSDLEEDRYLLLLAIESCRGADMTALVHTWEARTRIFYENGDTLQLAAKMNNETVIKMLVLKHNVDADYREARGDTPLMEATTSHRGIDTGKLFLQSPRVNLNQ
ncbi:hypothetical protein V8C26DRAFT_386420 [Trichoderma gracile]